MELLRMSGFTRVYKVNVSEWQRDEEKVVLGDVLIVRRYSLR